MTVLRIALLSKPLNNFQELLYSHLSGSKGGGMTSPYTYLTFEYEFHTWKKNCHSEYCFKYLVFWLDDFGLWVKLLYPKFWEWVGVYLYYQYQIITYKKHRFIVLALILISIKTAETFIIFRPFCHLRPKWLTFDLIIETRGSQEPVSFTWL
jgi:hypothetical protein